MSLMTPLVEGPWKLAPGFLGPWPNVLFFFVDFILYVFAVINYSHEYNSVLSPVCSPNESPNLEVVFGTPNTSICDMQHDS